MHVSLPLVSAGLCACAQAWEITAYRQAADCDVKSKKGQYRIYDGKDGACQNLAKPSSGHACAEYDHEEEPKKFSDEQWKEKSMLWNGTTKILGDEICYRCYYYASTDCTNDNETPDTYCVTYDPAVDAVMSFQCVQADGPGQCDI